MAQHPPSLNDARQVRLGDELQSIASLTRPRQLHAPGTSAPELEKKYPQQHVACCRILFAPLQGPCQRRCVGPRQQWRSSGREAAAVRARAEWAPAALLRSQDAVAAPQATAWHSRGEAGRQGRGPGAAGHIQEPMDLRCGSHSGHYRGGYSGTPMARSVSVRPISFGGGRM